MIKLLLSFARRVRAFFALRKGGGFTAIKQKRNNLR